MGQDSTTLSLLGLPQTEYNRVLHLTYRHHFSAWEYEGQYREQRYRRRYLDHALKGAPPQGIRADLLVGDNALTEAQVAQVCEVLLVEGSVSTAAAIGSALYRLAGDWGTCMALRVAPEMTRPFVEEILRTAPPIPAIGRTALRDVTLRNGIELDAGDEVTLDLHEASTTGGSLTFGVACIDASGNTWSAYGSLSCCLNGSAG